MIYIRIKKRVTAAEGEALVLSRVADVLADASFALSQMPVVLPKGKGVWQVDALQLILQIQERAPREIINVLGDGIGWLHREEAAAREKNAAPMRWLTPRVWNACLLLIAGSMLAIGLLWANVNINPAQATLSQTPGGAVGSPFIAVIPYVLSALLCILLYYALIGKKNAPPLSAKLRQYQKTFAQGAQSGGTPL